jgi:membrane protein DedA with SNARE-associated domain
MVVLWGTVGNLFGSIIAYYAGFYGGRPFIERYGKYILIDKEDLDGSQKFFEKYGSPSIFFSRLLPVVRTFISLPAGISKMSFWKFCFYTFIGSLPWSVLLAYIGFFFGENWEVLGKYFHKFDWAILVIGLVIGIWWIGRKFKKITNKK